jgi:mannose-6-phosphate isomerase-like protein (cupin superfamily)
MGAGDLQTNYGGKMSNDLRAEYEGKTLDELHQRAEAKVVSFSYAKPAAEVKTKGSVKLARGELLHGVVQVIKKNGGENNLHYHTNVETLWWVIKGRARFYGPGDVLLKEVGPGEGMVTPRYSRYWFECISDEELELLQVAASDSPNHKNGRTDAAPRHANMERRDFRITSSGNPA